MTHAPRPGRLLAVALPLVLAACLSGCSFATESVRDESGVVTEDNDSASVFDMRVGDCYDEPDSTADEVETLPARPCADPHDYEVFASVDVPEADDYPGDDAVEEQAQTECMEGFESFVGISYDESELDFSYLTPTKASWPQGDREITCLVYSEDKVTGSLEGSKR